MSGASTWLHGQRKTELVDLADKVGLENYENLKKADLETALDEFMRSNQTRLSKDSSLQPYFKRISGSPVKKEVALLETKTPARAVRKTVKDTAVSSAEAVSSLIHSPRANLSLASNVPLPPSPAAVAQHIDRQTAKVRSSISKAYEQSGLTEWTEGVRDKISNSASIESLVIFVELIGLRTQILPAHVLAVIPASTVLGSPELPVKVPDLFAMLTADFWTILTLWLTTSIVLPMASAYFFNLTLKAKHGRSTRSGSPAAQYDPLTFNITKALISWIVYGQAVRMGGFPSMATVASVDAAIPGGHRGVLIGSGIGALTSIYEAILRK